MKWWKLLLGPAAAVLVYFLFKGQGFEGAMPKAAALGTWIALWWITEAVNIYVTALLPVVLFPLFGVMSIKDVAPLYMKDIIFLFIGGFLIAYALERWNLHKRIALKIILSIGHTPSRVLLGFMLASYFLSMWILNTATVTLLLPAVLGVIQQIEEVRGQRTQLATPFLLGLAYASSIGGIATLIGTAPNMVMQEFYNTNAVLESGAEVTSVTFANWFAFGFPVSLVLFVVCYLLLRFLYRKQFSGEAMDLEYCRRTLKEMGPMSYEEYSILGYFIFTVLLWFFRKDLDIGSLHIPGWANLLPEPDFVKESAIAMFTGVLLFLHPSKQKKGEGLITWTDAKRLPVGILFLFGGGFALAAAFTSSGLTAWMGEQLSALQSWTPALIIVTLCLIMTFLTELTSNTASTILVMPIILSMCAYVDVHPLKLFVPVTLAASCAFMLPVATPPNTIVFGSERLSIRSMMRAGIWLNLIGVVIISLLSLLLLEPLFGL